MKKKLLTTFLGAYVAFFVVCFLTANYLTPRLLRHYLYAISEAEDYRNYLAAQFVAIQNFCHILLLFVFIISLLPVLVFWIKIYRPMNKIGQAAAQFMDGKSHPPIPYDQDDELGRLTASINYLASKVDNSGQYQRKFISNISHDFRSPLTSIKGYVEAMLDGTIPPEMQERYLGIVLSETDRLNKLTEGLLTLNTLDDRHLYLDLTDFDLIPVIQNTLASFEGMCGKKEIRIETVFPETALFVHADLARIQQVFYNLIDNAIKFSHQGGLIRISLSVRRKLVYVSVKDFGEGISSEHLPKIWDRFYKSDTSRGRDKKGSGLGLSIVREIIQLHNQNINVVSTEGVGTEFVFTLDKAAEPVSH